MSGIKDRLYKVNNRLNFKWFGVFIVVVVLTYLAHDRILAWGLIPAFNYLHGLPYIGGGIDWLLLYGGAETWNWHTISAVAISSICVLVFGYYWGRHSIEVIEVNPELAPAVVTTPEPAATPSSDVDAKIAELTKEIEAMKQEKAAT